MHKGILRKMEIKLKSNHNLESENISKLLVQLSLPAMVGMLVMALYNIIDTIFVGRGVGTNAIAALSIVFPIQMLVMAAGLLYGMGGASVISRQLGEGAHDRANTTYGNIAVAAIISGLGLTIVGMIFRDPILQIFGASAEILPMSRDYYNLIILSSPLFVMAMTGNNVLRSVGMAKSAMMTMLVGAVGNIILDPIFIFGFDMGVRGAALATVIAQLFSVLYLIKELTSKRCSLRLRKQHLKIDKAIMKEVMAIGFSSFIRNVAGSFIFALVNNKLLVYGTEVSVAAYGVVIKLMRFLLMPLIGIAQGLQPIIGFNYGARKFDLVEKAAKLGLLYGSIISVFGFIIAQLFPEILISVFTDDVALLTAGSQAMRIMMLGIWVVGFQIVGTTIFQALGKARESLLLSLVREVIFLIPLLIVLPQIFQVNGIWMAIPLADVFSAVLTIVLLANLSSKIKQRKRSAALAAVN